MSSSYFSDSEIELKFKPSYEMTDNFYDDGYLAGRKSFFYFYRTYSLRINLSKFKLTSENRRVLRKKELVLQKLNLPYVVKSPPSWQVQKLAKDFYSTKFGQVDFSANNIRAILKGNYLFDCIFRYRPDSAFAISLSTEEITHYAYPFYDLFSDINNLGMSMMLNAIQYAKKNKKKYIYLGGVTRSSDKYKLQFEGVEWFNVEKKMWSSELDFLKYKLSSM